MTETDELCVLALARSDAARLPIRSWRGSGPSNRHFWRKWLAADGLPLPFRDRDAAGRKRQERALHKLARSGLATVRTAGGAKVPRVKLTLAAELQTRARCGLPGLALAFEKFAELVENARPSPVLAQELFIIETRLNDGRGYGECSDLDRAGLLVLEQCFCVWHSLGLADCGSDRDGRTSYRVTHRGWAMLDGIGETEKLPHPLDKLHALPLPEHDPRAENAYHEHLAAALQELAGPLIDSRQIGALPLPCGFVGMKAEHLEYALA